MLTVTKLGKFKKYNAITQKAEDRYRYAVTGSEEEIAQYEALQGEYNQPVEDEGPFEGQPLHISSTNTGPDGSTAELALNRDQTKYSIRLSEEEEGIQRMMDVVYLEEARKRFAANRKGAPVAAPAAQEEAVSDGTGADLN